MNDRRALRRARACGAPMTIAALVAVCIAALLAANLAGPARARTADMRAARAHYPGIAGSPIDNCALCHITETSRNLDPYGRDWHENDDDFEAIESLDSDGDGHGNLAEILAFTYPGKADSLPGPTPTQLPGPPASETPTPEPTPAATSPSPIPDRPTATQAPTEPSPPVFLPSARRGR